MKILFLVPYPLHESPSQRFRFEQYFHRIEQAGHSYRVQTFLPPRRWRLLSQPGHGLSKLYLITLGFLHRILAPWYAISSDRVFIHREVTPIGPPIFEWIIARLLRKKVIFDFDDAIWLTDRQHESAWFRWLKWRSKVALISTWSYRVSCGNEYLASFARKFNQHVTVNPTTIDTSYHIPEKKVSEQVVIGWTGSRSTMGYLNDVKVPLEELMMRHPHVVIRIVSDQAPDWSHARIDFVPWSLETEIPTLQTFDIGIMPLRDDPWSLGKCGFKALQYMSLSIPAVVSPVGVNTEVVVDTITGYHCRGGQEWINRLDELIRDRDKRTAMGLAGRRRVEDLYSVASNTARFLRLLEE